MFPRRRATQAELDQGIDEMRRAQQRVEAKIATGSEKQLEDTKGPETMVPESPSRSGQEKSPATPASQVRTDQCRLLRHEVSPKEL